MLKFKNKSFRGYVSSRPINGNTIPQSLQNLKIRDYAIVKNIEFKLSITEYRMKNTYYALNSLKTELGKIDGVIFFSIYQLPEQKETRKKIVNYFIKKKKNLFFALEDIEVKNLTEVEEIELIYFISKNSAKPTN